MTGVRVLISSMSIVLALGCALGGNTRRGEESPARVIAAPQVVDRKLADPEIDRPVVDRPVNDKQIPLGAVRPDSAMERQSRDRAGADSNDFAAEALLGQLLGIMVPHDQLPALAPSVSAGKIGLIGLLGHADSALSARLRALQQQAGMPLFIASDEESARVQRLDRLIYPLPSARRIVDRTLPEVEALFFDYGKAMARLGVTVNFAPLVDVGFGPGIRQRSLGGDPSVVINYAGAIIDGLKRAGVMPVLKHFPGHGRASADSHKELPTTPPVDLMSQDLLPYRRLLDEGIAVMVGHLNVPGLGDGRPASLSEAAISGLLRTQLGFDGLVITDAFDMGAITQRGPVADSAIRAINAGADIVLLGRIGDIPVVYRALARAYAGGELDRGKVAQSLRRISRYKQTLLQPSSIRVAESTDTR